MDTLKQVALHCGSSLQPGEKEINDSLSQFLIYSVIVNHEIILFMLLYYLSYLCYFVIYLYYDTSALVNNIKFSKPSKITFR